MARGRGDGGKPSKRPIERYEHKDKKRTNNPPVGLVTPETDPVAPTHKTYGYVTPVPSIKPRQELDYDPHLDPQLVWVCLCAASSRAQRILANLFGIYFDRRSGRFFLTPQAVSVRVRP
jgi:Uma2 family endonuclease